MGPSSAQSRRPLVPARVPAIAFAAAADVRHRVGKAGSLPFRRRAGRQRPGGAAEPEAERTMAAGPGGALGADVAAGLDQ